MQQQALAAATSSDQQLMQEQQEQQDSQQNNNAPQQVAQIDVPPATANPAQDISMEPPGHLGTATDAAGSNAAGSGRSRPPSLQPQHMSGAAPPQASPITLLAKAIGSGSIQPQDVPVGSSLGLVKQEHAGHPAAAAQGAAAMGLATAGSCPTPNFAAMAGLNSPLFPIGVSSPNLSCVASPAQQAKLAENFGIDPEIWFANEDGNALGMGDMFKDNTSIYQPPPAGEQQDTDLVAAW